jgi:hypothetical protein
MRRSTDHILSSHGGNLPRPPGFDDMLADPQKKEVAWAKLQAMSEGAEVATKRLKAGR